MLDFTPEDLTPELPLGEPRRFAEDLDALSETSGAWTEYSDVSGRGPQHSDPAAAPHSILSAGSLQPIVPSRTLSSDSSGRLSKPLSVDDVVAELSEAVPATAQVRDSIVEVLQKMTIKTYEGSQAPSISPINATVSNIERIAGDVTDVIERQARSIKTTSSIGGFADDTKELHEKQTLSSRSSSTHNTTATVPISSGKLQRNHLYKSRP
jgi:hypothetical protein